MPELLSPEEIDKLLHQHFIGHLGCHTDKEIYIVPIGYAYDGEYLYGHTYEGRKLTMMRQNPNICLQIDQIENMNNWRSIIVWGIFEELTKKEDRLHAQQVLHSKTLPFAPNDMSVNELAFFRVKPTKKTGCIFIKNKEAGTRTSPLTPVS